MNTMLKDYLENFDKDTFGEYTFGINYNKEYSYIPERYKNVWNKLSIEVLIKHIKDYRIMFPKSVYLGKEINTAESIGKTSFGLNFIKIEDGIAIKNNCNDRDILRFIDEDIVKPTPKIKENIFKKQIYTEDIIKFLTTDINKIRNKDTKDNVDEFEPYKIINLNTHRYMYQISEARRFLEYLYQIYINVPEDIDDVYTYFGVNDNYEFTGDILPYELNGMYDRCMFCGFNFTPIYEPYCFRCGKRIN